MDEYTPKIGVVIGSGGIKPLGAVELFDFFEEEGIKPSFLVGCSGGAMTVSAKGLGISTDTFKEHFANNLSKELFNDYDFNNVRSILNISTKSFDQNTAFLNIDKILALHKKLYGDKQLEDCLIPIHIQLTDLKTAKGVVLSKGPIVEIVYASGAILPFFPPMEVDGNFYADGGFTTSLPTQFAVKKGADIIIAVNFYDATTTPPSTFFESWTNFLKKTDQHNIEMKNLMSILIHHHEIISLNIVYDRNIQLWEVDALPMIYEKTKKEIQKNKDNILRSIDYIKKTNR